MTDIEYQCLTGEDATEVLSDEYVRLYLKNYAEPPYLSGPLSSRERFLERTGRQVKNDSFVLVSARDGSELVGFSFGLAFGVDRWWAGEAAPAPAELAGSPRFAVIELDVREDYRRRGIGRQLLETLLAQQDAPYATLLADPDAPAHAMYQRWGWRLVGAVRAAPDARASDALVLDLSKK
ncbi:GNAT family N-acetyltransferase [Streptosporangium sp. NBC_01469]|uniref:GNAT family N-acetyltransferase n=1 Tax=Streptosporangium sp. NBC_01469 TaxID=2903898 RepID=UPI002E27D001|nr:GNAT family N-acetyltransferase [Streptosporangium sp. NBC_01469]